jgi:hypothetical protein
MSRTIPPYPNEGLDGACSTHGRNAEGISVLLGKPEVEKLFGRPKNR